MSKNVQLMIINLEYVMGFLMDPMPITSVPQFLEDNQFPEFIYFLEDQSDDEEMKKIRSLSNSLTSSSFFFEKLNNLTFDISKLFFLHFFEETEKDKTLNIFLSFSPILGFSEQRNFFIDYNLKMEYENLISQFDNVEPSEIDLEKLRFSVYHNFLYEEKECIEVGYPKVFHYIIGNQDRYTVLEGISQIQKMFHQPEYPNQIKVKLLSL